MLCHENYNARFKNKQYLRVNSKLNERFNNAFKEELKYNK